MHRFKAATAQALNLSDFLQETFYEAYTDSTHNVLVVTREFLAQHIINQIMSIMNDITKAAACDQWAEVELMTGTVEIYAKDLERVTKTTAEVIMFDDDNTFVPKAVKP